MTRICVLSHSFQHSAQIRASMSAPSEPGIPTFPAPSRCSPHRAQMTTAMRSMLLTASPDPADPTDRPVTEERPADDVPERDRAERSAVRALVRTIAEHRAGTVRDARHALQDEALGVPRVADEDDLADTGTPCEGRDDDPVALAKRRLHASPRHGHATEHAARPARRPPSPPSSPGA